MQKCAFRSKMLPQKWMCREFLCRTLFKQDLLKSVNDVRIYEIRGFSLLFPKSTNIYDIWSHVNRSTFGAGSSIFCFQFIYHYDCLKSKIHIKKLDVIHKRFFLFSPLSQSSICFQSILLFLTRTFSCCCCCCFFVNYNFKRMINFFSDNVYLNKAF